MSSILIVDDEDYAVEGIRAGIHWEQVGIDTIFTAFSVKQARDMILQRQIDVILCDIEMPQESGIDFLFWLRQSDINAAVIFLTCHDDFSLIQQGLRLGCIDFLLKPVDSVELMNALKKALHIGNIGIVSSGKGPICANPDEAESRKSEQLLSYETRPDKRESTTMSLLPDTTRWTVLLENGARERVRNEIRSYVNSLPPNNRKDPLFLSRLQIDIQQIITGILRMRSISPHKLLNDGYSRDLFQTATDNPENFLRWVDYMLEELYDKITQNDEEKTPFGKACEYISRHICDDLSCDRVASFVNLNPDYLTRLFKKETGLSVSEYVTRSRMIFASELLRTTKRSVSEIALQIGYANPSHFSKVFKHAFAQTPVEYRASHSPNTVVH